MRAFDDLGMDGTDVFPHDADKKQLYGGEEEHANDQGSQAEGKIFPKNQLGDKVDNGNQQAQPGHDKAKHGRKPGLALVKNNKPISLMDWASEILEGMLPYADLLDATYGGQNHVQAVLAQHPKVSDPDATPSARLLQHLRDEGIGLHDYTLRQSRAHHEWLRANPLDAAVQEQFMSDAAQSLRAQLQIEQSDTESFDEYVARYHAGLKNPASAVHS